ncbi:hypothetical protein ACFQ4I_23630, partial [Methylorubrum suomiense]
MATDKKLKDPAEAALSAIEQALNLDIPTAGDAARVEPRLPDVGDNDPLSDPLAEAYGRRIPNLDLDHLGELPPPERGRSRREGGLLPPDRSLVANDDRQNIGILQQTLRVRPSRKPYIVAGIASLLWLGGLVALAWNQSGGDLKAFVTGLTALQGAVVATAIAGPIVLFLITAMLAVRAHEMRLVARAVGEVAIRLAEPESFSTDAVLTMSQTVRREVAAVGDGVERALARAGELETLVRGEISTLERAYSDNEIRIRTLVDELVAQRESIVANADRVRGAIAGSHENLSSELDGAAERIVAAINGAGERVTGALDARSDAITAALGEVGERVVGNVSTRGDDLVRQLEATSAGVRGGLETIGTNLTVSLQQRADEVTEAFERTGGALTRTLADNAGAVAKSLAETGTTLIEALDRQGGSVRETFERSAKGLEETFLSRGTELTDRFAQTGGEITARFAETGEGLRRQFAATGTGIAEDITARGATLRAEIEIAGAGVSELIEGRGRDAQAALALAAGS